MELLTVGSAARELGVSRYRIHQLIRAERFPYAQQLDSGQWLIERADLEANRVRKPGRPRKGTKHAT